jgi:hypothetical protein
MNQVSKIIITGTLLLAYACAYAQNAPTVQETTNVDGMAVQPGNMLGASTSAAQKQMQASKNQGAFKAITPDTMSWSNFPSKLPAGGQYSILDQSKTKGTVILRIKLPANYQLPPVYSPTAERITVLSGSLNIGAGDKLDTSNGTNLPAGSFLLVPANTHYYFWTTEDTILQTTVFGGWNLKYVNSKDDPRNSKSTSTPVPNTTNSAPTSTGY